MLQPFQFALSRLRGGAWSELPPRLPASKAVVVPIRVVAADPVFPHRRAV